MNIRIPREQQQIAFPLVISLLHGRLNLLLLLNDRLAGFLHHSGDGFHDGGKIGLQMPEMTGLELQQNLARKGIRIPTIIITANDEAGMREHCKAAGAIAYLAKPLQDTSLFAAIDAASRSAKN